MDREPGLSEAEVDDALSESLPSTNGLVDRERRRERAAQDGAPIRPWRVRSATSLSWGSADARFPARPVKSWAAQRAFQTASAVASQTASKSGDTTSLSSSRAVCSGSSSAAG